MKSFAWLIVCALLLASACSSRQKPQPPPSSVAGMEKVLDVKDGEAWRKPGATLADYDRFILDPAQCRIPGYDPATASVPPDQLRILAEYFSRVLREAIPSDYPLVTSPGPRTLRITPIITGVEPSNPVMNTITSVVPLGIVLSLAESAATGKASYVGSASVEIEFHDALSGELVGLYRGQKDGEKYDSSGFSETGVARKAFEEWAQLLRRRIFTARGKTG
ncbi:Protein of unknown function DUF3313 [Desulfovibrio sp. X2]|uniref:DUF3313 domain-containing protein n=1 Tax=Desulfovibrio sp. X2 TaxID=941449 RepID=UPI000358884A|nr:DUF3313 domain-containing protein [Desulfovibrio sp. X2]EPR40502.1 Protein of unknown function DUF3313 [Desulfovibrio sp. X2]